MQPPKDTFGAHRRPLSLRFSLEGKWTDSAESTENEVPKEVVAHLPLKWQQSATGSCWKFCLHQINVRTCLPQLSHLSRSVARVPRARRTHRDAAPCLASKLVAGLLGQSRLRTGDALDARRFASRSCRRRLPRRWSAAQGTSGAPKAILAGGRALQSGLPAD
eukprot:scaffold1764_cov236-Pinguiococcus_pyrenoidosus.AAC.11